MSNERKTEAIVREYLKKRGYYDDAAVVVEEQQSENPRIQKLLKNASKNGDGKGYPEFIIQSKDHPDFLIVIECKPNVTKHISKDLNRFSEYAVDGALLYASYLSKEYDVLAIGISGETKKEARISHFLTIKNGRPEEFPGDTILSFSDYYDSYMRNHVKFNQEYGKLLDFSKDINEVLHAKRVKESQRSLLISGILIALRNKAFLSSFKDYKTAPLLTKNLVETIVDELTSEDLPPGTINGLKQAFSFINTHATLSTDKEFLQELIVSIDKNINSFLRTYKYFDTIGQFYIEFLRYANNDKGLGIVLTPPHITELFSELAGVNKDSIILDNCCGTGGFLISAMKAMVLDAKGDSTKIKRIKKQQIIGIEFQDDIYALAVSNMIIHDDGKSNVHRGDCFMIASEIKKKYHPNVGFLNPPYKTEKSDVEELEFVLNNLDMLEPHGTCIAILPLGCVLTQSGVGKDLKQKILEKHTLEAVMSMPSELFHNSDINVVTAIIVLTAKVPHPKNKKTWFGYWRDDGFVKIKERGRIDLLGVWESIKKTWMSSYRNREVIPGLSVMQEVTAKDEWCAEAYMKTDYSNLERDDFEKDLKKYVVFKIMNENGNSETE